MGRSSLSRPVVMPLNSFTEASALPSRNSSAQRDVERLTEEHSVWETYEELLPHNLDLGDPHLEEMQTYITKYVVNLLRSMIISQHLQFHPATRNQGFEPDLLKEFPVGDFLGELNRDWVQILNGASADCNFEDQENMDLYRVVAEVCGIRSDLQQVGDLNLGELGEFGYRPKVFYSTLIVGPVGSGKTHLLEELRRSGVLGAGQTPSVYRKAPGVTNKATTFSDQSLFAFNSAFVQTLNPKIVFEEAGLPAGANPRNFMNLIYYASLGVREVWMNTLHASLQLEKDEIDGVGESIAITEMNLMHQLVTIFSAAGMEIPGVIIDLYYRLVAVPKTLVLLDPEEGILAEQRASQQEKMQMRAQYIERDQLFKHNLRIFADAHQRRGLNVKILATKEEVVQFVDDCVTKQKSDATRMAKAERLYVELLKEFANKWNGIDFDPKGGFTLNNLHLAQKLSAQLTTQLTAFPAEIVKKYYNDKAFQRILENVEAVLILTEYQIRVTLEANLDDDEATRTVLEGLIFDRKEFIKGIRSNLEMIEACVLEGSEPGEQDSAAPIGAAGAEC